MKRVLFFLLVIVTLFACQTRGLYCASENEMLYVKRKPSPTEGYYVFVDRFGQQRVPNPDTSRMNRGKDEFMEANEFSCGLALVRDLEGKWRYIDRKGKTVIDADYDWCWSFEEFYHSDLGFRGLARVNNGLVKPSVTGLGTHDGGKYGLINTKGEIVLPIEYDEIMNFDELDRSRWMILKDSLWGLIDDKAKMVVTPQYDYMKYYHGYATVSKNNTWGLINKRGKEVIPLVYDSIAYTSSGSYHVVKEGSSMLLNARGKVVNR